MLYIPFKYFMKIRPNRTWKNMCFSLILKHWKRKNTSFIQFLTKNLGWSFSIALLLIYFIFYFRFKFKKYKKKVPISTKVRKWIVEFYRDDVNNVVCDAVAWRNENRLYWRWIINYSTWIILLWNLKILYNNLIEQTKQTEIHTLFRIFLSIEAWWMCF